MLLPYRAALVRIGLCLCLLSAMPTYSQLTQPTNASFEEPARAYGEHLRPADTGWAFVGNAGIVSRGGVNGSHHGNQLAYLKGDPTAASRGRVSRTVRFANPGLYLVRFVSGGSGSVTVSVGGIVADTVSIRLPWNVETNSTWTQPFSISASGDYEVSFAQQSSVATDTAYIDNIVVVSAPVAFPNGSFEQANASKVPTGWSVTNATSELSGASGVGGSGLRELSVQPGGSASTTISVPAGTYSISFRSIGQSTCGATVEDVTGGGQTLLTVLANSSSPALTGFAPFTSSSFALPAGDRTLRISAQCARRFDSLILNRAGPTFANSNFETPALPPPASTYDVPWLANPGGASWTFSGPEAGIQATAGVDAYEPKADIGAQFGRVRAAGSSISQTVSLSPGTYLLTAQTASGNLSVRANGILISAGWGAGSSRLTENLGTPFLIAQQGSYTFTFEPGSAGSFALDMPRLLRIGEGTPPITSIALRLNGAPAPAQTLPGGQLEAIATAADPDGLQRIRVLRNGVALAPESTAAAPASATSPLTVTVSPLTAGSYTFTAEATDHFGSVATASQSILANTPPNVNLTAPIAGETVSSVPFTITAAVSDPDSGQLLDKVQFFSTVNGVTTMLGEVILNAPTGTASVNITNPKPGIHQIFARAIDALGGQRDSPPVQVTVAGLLNGSFEIPALASGTSCTGAGCTSNNAWQFLNTNDSLTSTVSGYSNIPTGTCRLNATAGTHGAFVIGGSPAGRLRQDVYLLPGVYDLFVSAQHTAAGAHSITASVAGSAPTTFALSSTYTTHQGAAAGYTIATAGVYPVIIDSATTTTTAVACIEEVRLVARNQRPVFSAFNVSPLGTVHEPAPPITMSASASDPDAAGYVASIEFLVNGQSQIPPLQCENTSSPPARPFSCTRDWLNAPPGQTHVISARAIDDRGAALGTTTHTVTRNVVVNAGPTLNFVYPTQFLAVPGSPVTLRVSATDTENDPIQYVEFFHYFSGELLGRVNAPTTGNEYHFSATLMPGSHTIGARSIDSRGAAAPAVVRQFTLNPGNQAPTILFDKSGDLNPEFGQTGVSFHAQAYDTDGQVLETWISVNGKVPCSPPVSATTCTVSLESNTPVGGYSVRAHARDNLGKVGASTNGFQVNVTPRRVTCTLTSARPNGVLVVNADNVLNVSCKDLNGSSIGLYTIGWDAPANCSNSFVATDTEVATCIVRPTSTTPIVYSAYVADSNNDMVNGPLEKTFTPVINQAPTISLVSPASETAIAAPATFTIAVNPFDPEGSIKRVELLNVPSQGSVTPSLARTAPPWTFTWSNVPAGTYANIKARVYDEFDAFAEVAIPTLVSNALPTVTITAPANGTAYAVGAQATFNATATDTDGTVTSVEYTATPVNSAVVAQRFVSTAPGFPFTWSNLPNGDYVVIARATDNRGMHGPASAAVTIRVNSPPTVRLVSPANGATIPADGFGARIQFDATDVSDPDGIASVEFEYSLGWNTTAWLVAANGVGTAPNYSAEWLRSLTANTDYSVRACATDARGQRGCDAPANITVLKRSVLVCTLTVVNPPPIYLANQVVQLSVACRRDGVSVSPNGFEYGWLRDGGNLFSDEYLPGQCSGETATCAVILPRGAGEVRYSVGVSSNTFPNTLSNEIIINVSAGSNTAPRIDAFSATPLSVSAGQPVSLSYSVFDPDASQNLVISVRDGNGSGNIVASSSVQSGGTRTGVLTWVTSASSPPTNVLRLEVSDPFSGPVLSSSSVTVSVAGGTGQPPDEDNPADVENYSAESAVGLTVGTLPGTPSVSPSGSVTYSIPIPVSPGTAGMQPSLSLSYNSQGGRSIAGTGWSLSGFSTIHRCPASPVIDGFKGRIDFGPEDRFCLDGARLISLGGIDGANGTEYRTERDSHSRVFSRVDGSNQSYWTVETKGGQTLEFKAPLYWSNGNNVSANSSKIKAWGVTRVQDTVGNYMLFDYTIDHNRGWLLPKTIYYTGNDSAPAVAPYASVSIDYRYDVRRDTGVIYDGTGSYGQTPPLVSAITSSVGPNVSYRVRLEYADGDSPTTGRARLTSVQLCGKGTSTADGLCMAPTVFDYNNAGVHSAPAWLLAEPQNIGFFLNAGRGKNMLALDKDGNGKTDILRSDYFVSATGQPELVLGDFNGDGISDVAYATELHTVDGPTGTARIYICLGQASGDLSGCNETDFGAEENFQSWYRTCHDGNICLNLPKLTAADFDGDGKSDLALSNGKIYLGFGENAPRIRIAPELGSLSGSLIFPGNSYVGGDSVFADFDGDGRMDFAHCIPPVGTVYCNQTGFFSRWKVYRSIVNKTDANLLATPAFVSIETDGPRKAGNPQAHVADLNGDGLADLLADAQPGGNAAPDGGSQNNSILALENKYRWHGCLSRGDGTMDCSIWYGPRNYETQFGDNQYGIEVLGDFNGDGRTDLAIYDQASSINHDTGGAWWVCVSRPWVTASAAGGLFDCSPSRDGGAITALLGGGKWTGGIRRNAENGQLKYDQVAVGDFYGDGRTGLAGGTPVSTTGINYPRIMRPNVNDSVANIPDMLASVTNGLGFKSSFKYKPITDNSIYRKGTGPGVYPKLNIQSPMYVATEISHDNGLAGGGQIRYTYKYEDLKGHTEGGGTLGFGKVIVKDEQSQIVTETTYDNDYPARGLVLSTVKKQANGQLLSRSSTTYKKVAPYKSSALTEKIHTYLTETTTDESWDLDGTPMPRTTTLTTYARLPDAQGDDILGNIDNNDERNRAFGCATSTVARTFAPNASTASFTKTSTNTYDNDVSNWRLCRLRTATVESTQSAYTYGNPNIIGSAETRSSAFTYKAGTSLLETETVQEGGAQPITLKTQYSHDRFGNRIQADVTGWNGSVQETRTSKTTYDDKGRFSIESENAAGHKEYPTHESVQGTLISLKGPNDLTTSFKYDRLGRKVTEIRPDRTKTAMSYEGRGASEGVKVTTKVTGGGETFVETDELGREVRKGVKIADYGVAKWSYITTVYDARGRVEKSSRPYFEGATPIYPVSRKYDNLDRVEEETLRNDDGSDTVTKTFFRGLETEVTVTALDAAGESSTRRSTSELDARGMTKKVTNTQDNTVEHMYDAAGNLVRTTRTVGAQKMVTAIEYDLRGRKTKLSDPDTGVYEYKYNAFGELIEQKDGNQVITYTKYDRLGRVTERASGGDLTSNYTYDACTKGKGKLCSVTAKGIMSPSNSSQTVGYTRTLTYDAYGRMETETSNIGDRTFVASTTYDASGRVKKITYPNGQFVTRGYDSVGAWNRLLDNQGRELWKGGAADAEARWRSWTLGNGRTTSTGFGANTGRLSSLATDGDVQSLALAYDGFGNIKTRLDALNNYRQSNGSAEAYRYDNLNQLIQADIFEGRQNITYDGFGRIVTKTGVNGVAGKYEYYELTTNDSNTSNRIQAANNRNYGYDDNGNVTSITGTAAGSITLSWTSFNQPMTLPVAASNSSVAGVLGNPNCNGQIVICFRYGADNERRIEFLPPDSNVLGGNQGTTRYHLHAGAALFYEEDVRADGSREQRAYFTGPLGVVALHTTNTDSAGNAVAPTGGNAHAQNNNGTPYTLTYWHRDHLGSLTVTTNDAGAVVQRMRYDPWGKPQTSLGSRTRAGDRGFTGHEHLAGGLIHMNGRIYDPVLGRFLSADIVVQFPDAITSYNRYAYVMNNPLAYTDPSGYLIQFLPIIWKAIVAAAPWIAGGAAIAGAAALATGHHTAARRFFAIAISFAGIHFAAGAAAAGTAAGNVAAGAWTIGTAFAAGGVQSGSIEGAIFAAMTAGAGIISAEIVSGLVTSLVEGVNNAFNSAAFSQTSGESIGSLASARAPDEVLTDAGKIAPSGPLSGGNNPAQIEQAVRSVTQRVEITGFKQRLGDFLAPDPRSAAMDAAYAAQAAGDHATAIRLATQAMGVGIAVGHVTKAGGSARHLVQDRIKVYRGVTEGHPGYSDATRGVANPRGGPSNAEAHTAGSTNSPYTSWTTDPSVARDFATLNGRGVVLEAEVSKSSLVRSLNSVHFNESEVLRIGSSSGAKVTYVKK